MADDDYPDDDYDCDIAFRDDYPEPCGSCDWCGCNIYPDDDWDGLCNQCAWHAAQSCGGEDDGIQPIN